LAQRILIGSHPRVEQSSRIPLPLFIWLSPHPFLEMLFMAPYIRERPLKACSNASCRRSKLCFSLALGDACLKTHFANKDAYFDSLTQKINKINRAGIRRGEPMLYGAAARSHWHKLLTGALALYEKDEV
jgi:hypothetical protein